MLGCSIGTRRHRWLCALGTTGKGLSMRRIGILGAALGSVVAMTTMGGAAQAHPPDNPYDNTIFAPIRTGGVRIGLATVTRGLTAPVKGVAVPGHRNRLFVADQAGR